LPAEDRRERHTRGMFFEALIWLVLTGLLVGGLARLALPGKDPLTIGQTILVGLAGAAVALVIQLVAGPTPLSLPLAVLAATGIVYLIRRRRGGSFSDPGPPPRRY
jgi:uncharacterized membrane protein YeaQ/YmgE (transglycosylase-associated protein family)